jgi:hypothetical protein
MAVQRFRKRPIEIEAMHWDGTAVGATPIIDWVLSGGGTASYSEAHQRVHGEVVEDFPATLRIETLEGTMRALPGDYIIRGVRGEHYSCRGDIFEETYESAPGQAPQC